MFVQLSYTQRLSVIKEGFCSEASLLGLPKSPLSLCVLLAFLRDKEKGDGKKERGEEMKRKIRNKTGRRREKEKNLVSITNVQTF